MTYDEIRKTFLNYFESHGHKIVPSASLIPNDPTLLFTVAGMVPWKGIFLGTEPAPAPRVADVQKCIRAGGKHNDLEDVGFDGRHHTFFEMLGNWSFGDYFKAGALEMSWDLLTRVIGIAPERLVVTTHKSDDEATELWKKIAGKEAIRLDKDNWWSAGDTGPCGPCSEIFYDFGADVPGGLPGTADEDGGRFVEIWNDVFMQYDRDANGNLTPLPNKNVDTGAGLERWAAMLQGRVDNYDTDLFVNLKRAVSDVTGVAETPDNITSFKVITDHLRSVGFAIADGVIPSNSDRGYVIRRILRRAMRHGQLLGHNGALLSELYPALVEQMGAAYPELRTNAAHVVEIITNEENAFADMLNNGMKLLDNELPKIRGNVLPGSVAFKLFDTYGFPLDLTQMILRDKNISVDVAGFESEMAAQKERSRADTRGTKIFWESRSELPATSDVSKYAPDENMTSKVLAILRDGEFIDSGNDGDTVEVALDKTNFYGTQGGQVGDTGELKIGDTTVMKVAEAARADGIVLHRGTVVGGIAVGDTVRSIVDSQNRAAMARAHTATHLLQAALRKVLNTDVEQRGSKVSPDSVRFDFSFGRAMTAEEKSAVENLVNEWIDADMKVLHEEMSIDDAKKRGAMALFGEKYGDIVRVITAGDVSCELCGGTHVNHTGEIMRAKINKEKSISSGIRRITMSVGALA
ncbi:MAG: alanine--tRNA ligase [Alphaproteobacteria bacterium]|nr:alanine--tRNA ligase [Alphaproteobacteria bacterium]